MGYLLVVGEAGLALIHQDVLDDPFPALDGPNIFGRRVVDAVLGKLDGEDATFEDGPGVRIGDVARGRADHLHERLIRDGCGFVVLQLTAA